MAQKEPVIERCPYCLRAANSIARRTAKRGWGLVKGEKPVPLPVVARSG